MFVYTAGHGVFGFTLDPAVGAYVLSHENMRMPSQGSYYSVNEANERSFPDSYRAYLERLRSGELGQTYSSRYIGSLVADFHRTLLKGGIFLYPPTSSHPEGKLRLLYEANPIAFIAEQAGGVATNGTGARSGNRAARYPSANAARARQRGRDGRDSCASAGPPECSRSTDGTSPVSPGSFRISLSRELCWGIRWCCSVRVAIVCST